MTASARPLERSPLRHRSQLRVCQLRATQSSEATGLDAVGSLVTDVLYLGRLTGFVTGASGLAPRVAAYAEQPELLLSGPRWGTNRTVDWQRLRIDLPGSGLVDARIVAVPWTSLVDAIGLLNDLFFEHLEGEPAGWDRVEISDPGVSPEPTKPFHQLVFLPDNAPKPNWDKIQRLVYRADLDARKEHSSIQYPAELNRRLNQVAAVGEFGSVLWGLQDYVESGAVLSAAIVVSATESLQHTRQQAHIAVRELHRLAQDNDDIYATARNRQHIRSELVDTQETISHLEAELTFGAEASATITPLLPSLRIESYHRALYNAASIDRQAQLVDRMLSRLRASCDAELGALRTVETSIAELRIRRWSIAAQTLAVITIPLSLILAYFGMSTGDITSDMSLFDLGQQWPVYAATLALVGTVSLLVIAMQVLDRRQIPRSSRASRYYTSRRAG